MLRLRKRMGSFGHIVHGPCRIFLLDLTLAIYSVLLNFNGEEADEWTVGIEDAT